MQQQRAGTDIRLAEVIAALSLATDLGTGQPMEQALRRCLLAVHLGELVGLSDDDLRAAYYLALLQYIGCTSDAHVIASVFGDEVSSGAWYSAIASAQPVEVLAAMLRHIGEGSPPWRRARTLASAFAGMPSMGAVPLAHCEVGQRLAERLGFGPDIQRGLGQVYERWDGGGQPARLRGEAMALPVRVVKLAQDAETFHRISGVAAAVTMARERAGAAHDPRLVERFCQEASRLFARLEEGPSWEAVLRAEPGAQWRLSPAEFDVAIRAIADFVDLKSPYFAGHSSGVATLAAEAARRSGLSEPDLLTVRHASLLHDLGRVGVSAGLWGKPGPLTDGEWERVRLHPYYTERILARPKIFVQLGALASLHHERLDGSGYHRGARAASVPMAARLIAAADDYHALTEPRPHRPARSADEAAETVRREVVSGRLDGEAVDAVLTAAGHLVRSRRRAWPAGLSQREIDVLRLVARGLSDRKMGERLYLSPATVHHHVQHIYGKIGVSTRAAAALFAMQHDLLSGGGPSEK